MFFSWNKYTVMHKNRKVACICKNGTCVIYSRQFMPYNLYLEEETGENLDACVNNLENFYYWCSSRVLTLDRKYAKEILNALGKKQSVTDRDRAEISISYHCLSLTDVYWVKEDYETESFEEINLYEHFLSDALVDVCLQGKGLTLENRSFLTVSEAAGDVSTAGTAPKAWVRQDDSFYLLKDGDLRDVEAELLASKILDCFDVAHVQYREEFYHGQKISVCTMISSQDKSLVPAEYVSIYASNHDMDLRSFLEKKDPSGYHLMNICDYLLGNSDRHWGNWGFYVDNETNELLNLYPLMDFNKSFTAYSDMTGGGNLPSGSKMTQQEAAAEAMKSIGLRQLQDVDKAWFQDLKQWEMFNARLNYLKSL